MGSEFHEAAVVALLCVSFGYALLAGGMIMGIQSAGWIGIFLTVSTSAVGALLALFGILEMMLG